MPSALEGSTVQELEKLDNFFKQTAVTYKEIRNDDPPPQRVSKNNATPQKVTHAQPPSHLPPCKKEPER